MTSVITQKSESLMENRSGIVTHPREIMDLRELFVILTYNCNANCECCIERNVHQKGIISDESFDKALSFAKEKGLTSIFLHGGEPTLHPKDIMILNKSAYYFSDPERFDIVVVSMPDEYLIKRVIGLPGENIKYVDNTLYVDGEKIEEPIADLETDDFDIEELGATEIPDDSYLVLGDNRDNSLDSRELGFISKDRILGKATFIILPFSRFGGIS